MIEPLMTRSSLGMCSGSGDLEASTVNTGVASRKAGRESLRGNKESRLGNVDPQGRLGDTESLEHGGRGWRKGLRGDGGTDEELGDEAKTGQVPTFESCLMLIGSESTRPRERAYFEPSKCSVRPRHPE